MVTIEVFLGLSLLFFLAICSGLLRWNEVRYRRKGLPPGTMGWPLFGETTEFLKQGPIFLKTQRAGYGNLFRSHILGCPTVISMDPEVNKCILNEVKGLVPGYPQSMLDILGKSNIAAVDGALHKAMRSVMLSLISPTMIRDQLLGKLDEFMRSFVSDWDGKDIDIQVKSKEMWLLSALKLIASLENSALSKALETQINKLLIGTFSLPFKFPGTNYYQGLQARKKIISMLENIIEDHKHSRGNQENMLDYLLRNGDDKREDLTDEQLIDLIITLIYSGFETVSTTTMMVIKYLHQHPKVLKTIMNEHMDIRARKLPEEALNWDEYKSMTFTRAVIFETLRLATVVNGVLRKTTQDMELKGFLIPKGWRIYVYMRETNFDPCIYPESSTFNPWRWLDKNLETHQYFTAFGGGNRLCPGKELGIVEVATFLHYFLTKYRWEEVGDGKIANFPRVEAPNGLHIRVSNL